MAINLIVINLNLFYFPSTISWRDRRKLQNPIPVGETTTCCVDIRNGNKVETITHRDQKSRILPSSAVALLTDPRCLRFEEAQGSSRFGAQEHKNLDHGA